MKNGGKGRKKGGSNRGMEEDKKDISQYIYIIGLICKLVVAVIGIYVEREDMVYTKNANIHTVALLYQVPFWHLSQVLTGE